MANISTGKLWGKNKKGLDYVCRWKWISFLLFKLVSYLYTRYMKSMCYRIITFPNFYIVWRVNNCIYILLTYFYKYIVTLIPHGFIFPHPHPASYDEKNFLATFASHRASPYPVKFYFLLICTCKDQIWLEPRTRMDPGPQNPNNKFVESGIIS